MIITFNLTPYWAYQGTVADMPEHIRRAWEARKCAKNA